MCIVSLHCQDHPTYKLIVAANRDEFYERPTAQAGYWSDHPTILGGRDLRGMGTWLGITAQGRIAMLTNYRNLAAEIPDRKSRGQIVNEFLISKAEPLTLFEQLQHNRTQYNGFNVIAGTVDELYHYGNNESSITKLTSGTYSVSNGTFGAKWPKTTRAKHMLHEYVKQQDDIVVEDLFQQLNNREIAADPLLPQTGIELSLERNLSSIFIDKVPNYGTRVSTVILVSHHNEVTFVERMYDNGQYADERQFSFSL